MWASTINIVAIFPLHLIYMDLNTLISYSLPRVLCLQLFCRTACPSTLSSILLMDPTIDLNSDLLFSDPAYKIATPHHLHIHLNDPRLILQYCTVLHEHINHHEVFNKLDKLKQKVQDATWDETKTQ